MKKVFLKEITSKNAFTLAEVLITLAIIGIVAALTIPALISKHKKTVVVQRLQKISSVLQQAYNLSKVDYGDAEREGFEPYNPDAALEMFNKYYVPYIKFDRVEKGTDGVFGYMNDDSAIYFLKTAVPTSGSSNTYIIACVSHKACQDMKETASTNGPNSIIDGKTRFVFYTDGRVPSWSYMNQTRAKNLADCANGAFEPCTVLIWEAGWQIPKDYPIKF